ncbi:16S rRNA (guanine(527)-N(7))-methyltransferase RsmG [Sphingomicrobium sp. XHP0235]|uniref:16S rRNA (guanine(527)-N(7))-methyltransferase RsmG n=1 Tax=Sphingomicrobium aquimarinum TaxID=3133971 RepID=UPI0031FF1C37
MDAIVEYRRLLLEENARQNLISRESSEHIDERHLIDSAQLLRFFPDASTWVDIGSGPGLPGLVIAILTSAHVALVEPRPRRTQFLETTIEQLRLSHRVNVVTAKAAAVTGTFDAITGRAVASLDKFLALSHHLSTEKTRWVLPKGRNAARELEQARISWHIGGRIEPSLTDSEAGIVIIDRAERRGRA